MASVSRAGFDCAVNPTAQLLEPEVRELIREGAFSELREALHGVPLADVADILAELAPSEAAVAFRFLKRDDAGEVFAYLSPEKQEELIIELGAEGATRVVEAMNPDDRVKLLDELPSEVAQRIVASLSPEQRKVTQAILGYPPRSVGRLMTPDYVRVKPEWTIAQALDHIRKHGKDAETVNVVYVVDEQGRLVDDIRLRQLLFADPSSSVESVMNRQFVSLRADQHQSEAVEMMQRYDRIALPVVDSRGVLVGIVTVDDVADVAQAQATETIQRLGGMQALETPFLEASVLSLFKKRIPWLALLFMSELLTSNAIAYFEDEIQRAAILAAFIPAIISSGGNSGSQSGTLVIRALGLREIEIGDWFRVLRRELMVAALLGLVIGCIGLVRINLFGAMGWFSDSDVLRHYGVLAWTIAATLFCVVIWGSVMGSMLPFIIKRMRLDPAASSTPFVATLVDVTGIVIYFSIAILMLRTTLLKPSTESPLPLTMSVEATVLAAQKNEDEDHYVEIELDSPHRFIAEGGGKIRVPTQGLGAGPPPAAGSRVRVHLEVQRATRVETLGHPSPEP